jgi:hypothetical protein
VIQNEVHIFDPFAARSSDPLTMASCSCRNWLIDVNQTKNPYHVGDSLVRLKSGCETLLLNGEGYGGVANSALQYYQITRPTKLSLASFNQVIGVVGSRFLCLITV